VNAYTISKLADDAGVSVHIVRDYEQRGLVRPCRCTPGGYRIYNDDALERLRFVLAGKAAGVPLDTLANLVRAMESGDRQSLSDHFGVINTRLDQQLDAIAAFKQALSLPSKGLQTRRRDVADYSPDFER
jgi:MerR family mercuric resistance operon transcriptional regulator